MKVRRNLEHKGSKINNVVNKVGLIALFSAVIVITAALLLNMSQVNAFFASQSQFVILGCYFLVDITAITFLCYGIFYKRYFDRDAVTANMLFNLFIFIVIVVLFTLNVGGIDMGFGFGLFAVLSLVDLRSETFRKTDVTYFFGSLSIALINALALPNFSLIFLLNVLIILGTWIIDNPRLLAGFASMRTTLDHIPEGIIDDIEGTAKVLSEKFGVSVISYSVKEINFVNDTVKVRIIYKDPF